MSFSLKRQAQRAGSADLNVEVDRKANVANSFARLLGLACLGLMLISPAAAASAKDGGLPRRAYWGAVFSQQADGFRADRIARGGSANALKMLPGDVITAVEHKGSEPSTRLAEGLHSVLAGQSIVVTVKRHGRDLQLRARTVARPRESYPGASVGYGIVPFRDGRLRSILVEPKGAKHAPIVFLIQGFSCGTIEAAQPDGYLAGLAGGFVRQGIAFFRVEKPGVGDSDGRLRCGEIDFATELQAFRAAMQHLVGSGYEPDRIFILGHSLGGMEAPLLADEMQPRGVIVYGTVLRNWADYMHDLDRVQDFMEIGGDVGREYDRSEQDRVAINQFFFAGRSLAEIVRDNPAIKQNVTGLFGWDGNGKTFGRSEQFMRDLAAINLPKAWMNAKSYVLSIYGATDIIALTSEDQRMIADIANDVRPGSAQFIEVPRTMHGMDLVGTREEYRKANKAAGDFTNGPFNPEVVRLIGSWVKNTQTRQNLVS